MKNASDLKRFDAKGTYDGGAADYETASARFWAHLSNRTVERMQLGPGGRVLDVPSGPGWSAVRAAERVGPSGRVLAIDSSEQMLDLARRHAQRSALDNLDYRVADMTRLQLGDERFDAVICVLGVFFAPDMSAMIADLWRLVRPGGELAITVLGPGVFEPAFSVWTRAVAAENPAVLSSFPWHRCDDPSVLEAAMREAGVTATRIAVEPHRVTLDSPDDWWLAVMGSGMRRAVIELGDGAERVRREVSARLVDEGIAHMEMPGAYALAIKPGEP